MFAPETRAQCFNNPIDESLAEALDPLPGPFNLVLCAHPISPAPCLKPAMPNAIPVSAGGSYASQEYELRAVRPSENGTPFTSVVWRTEWYDPGVGWKVLWDHDSKDSIANIELVSGTIYQAKFGATGLKPGIQHRFSVGWCRDYSGQRGCSCWSAPNTLTDPQPTTFPSLNPAPPANTTQRIQETFSRPFSTTPKRDPVTAVVGGDGFGPDAAWQDGFFSFTTAGNGSKIIKPTSGASYGFMPQAAFATYKAVSAGHQHSYAEVLWSLETVTSRNNWNFDVATRRHVGSGNMPRAYSAKFHRNQHGAGTKPRLSILRTFDGTPLTIDSVEFTSDATCQTGATPDCSCMPNLLGANAMPSQAVWLRVEVNDSGNPKRPDVVATVAWDDSNLPTCSDLNSCPHKCTLTKRDDTTQGISMVAALGEWELDAHEGDYHITIFSAGNQ